MCAARKNIDTPAQAKRYHRSVQAYVHYESNLDFLGVFLLINARTTIAIHRVCLLQSGMLIVLIVLGPMIFLFKDRIGFDCFELGLEISDSMAMGAAIGAATSIDEVIAQVLLLITRHTPIDRNHKL